MLGEVSLNQDSMNMGSKLSYLVLISDHLCRIFNLLKLATAELDSPSNWIFWEIVLDLCYREDLAWQAKW